jgi:hypothetical protein
MRYSIQPSFRNFFFLILLIACSSARADDWTVPKYLTGEWTSTQVVTVRQKNAEGKIHFAKDSVNIRITIGADGKVEGSCGSGIFNSCTITNNRGWFGRMFNWGSDYIITGTLLGNIFPGDTIIEKEISIPFNLTDGVSQGTLFQKHGADIFPMVNIRLIRTAK